MNKKFSFFMKQIKYYLLFLFLGLIPFSCFKNAEFPYFLINSMTIKSYKDFNLTSLINTNDSIDNDSVFFKLNLGISYITKNKYIDLNSSCYATKKPYNGMGGLKDKIDSIYFTSNNLFNGRNAGTNLFAMLKTVKDDYTAFDYHNFEYKIIDCLNSGIPDRYPNTNENYVLWLMQRPIDSLKHNFTLKIKFKSGNSISAYTSVIWK